MKKFFTVLVMLLVVVLMLASCNTTGKVSINYTNCDDIITFVNNLQLTSDIVSVEIVYRAGNHEHYTMSTHYGYILPTKVITMSDSMRYIDFDGSCRGYSDRGLACVQCTKSERQYLSDNNSNVKLLDDDVIIISLTLNEFIDVMNTMKRDSYMYKYFGKNIVRIDIYRRGI
jgi:hypothetical protein